MTSFWLLDLLLFMDILRDVYLNYAIKPRVVGRFVKILVKQDKVELSSLSVFTLAFVVVWILV